MHTHLVGRDHEVAGMKGEREEAEEEDLSPHKPSLWHRWRNKCRDPLGGSGGVHPEVLDHPPVSLAM